MINLNYIIKTFLRKYFEKYEYQFVGIILDPKVLIILESSIVI